MNRITARDHRAVVIRCTATNTAPACDSAAQNSQFAWKARHTRSGATNNPMMNTTTPMANTTTIDVLNDFGISLFDAASTSLGDGTRGGLRLTAGAPAGSSGGSTAQAASDLPAWPPAH